MSRKKRRSYLLLLPFLLGIVVLLRFETERQKEHQAFNQEKQEAPQFFLDQAITTYYDASGKIEYQLNSEHLQYFKSMDIAQVWKPYFIFHAEDGKSWHSRSDQASLFNQTSDIQLTGNVRAWQPERNLELTTPSLFISDARSLAETDQLVHLKFPAGSTYSIGMKLDLQHEKLQLLSNVEGFYRAK